MRIESGTAELYRLPLARPLSDQTHYLEEVELTIVRLKADDGTVGDGYALTVGTGGAAIRKLIDTSLIPRLLGREVQPRPRWHELWRDTHDLGSRGMSAIALGAVDIALWDLLGKGHDQSLIQLLGPCRGAVPAYGSGVNLNLSIEELEHQVRRWVEQGYWGVKVKVGIGSLRDDRRRLRAVRKAIGDVPLMVDANQGWKVPQAIEACALFADLELTWLEEPLLAEDLLGYARLRERVSTPIAAGENLFSVHDVNQYLAMSACDYLQVDVVKAGGITPFLDIAALAYAWNVPLAPHHKMELSGQLLCCLPAGYLVEDLEGMSLTELGALKRGIQVEDGMYRPTNAPGHGLEFDFDHLAAFRAAESDGLGPRPPGVGAY
jgi:L-alanine-DL-glutamate epimerase-like enolase superfamily enzyme